MSVLAELRQKRGLSQMGLGRISGLSMVQICYMENGRANNPTVKTLVRLSDALECDSTVLFNAFAAYQNDGTTTSGRS
jgi:transcriptional regulator with XRE-family HTH domain